MVNQVNVIIVLFNRVLFMDNNWNIYLTFRYCTVNVIDWIASLRIVRFVYRCCQKEVDPPPELQKYTDVTDKISTVNIDEFAKFRAECVDTFEMHGFYSLVQGNQFCLAFDCVRRTVPLSYPLSRYGTEMVLLTRQREDYKFAAMNCYGEGFLRGFQFLSGSSGNKKVYWQEYICVFAPIIYSNARTIASPCKSLFYVAVTLMTSSSLPAVLIQFY